MQKQLIIRTPYVFFNKTKLTIEVVVRKFRRRTENPTAYSSMLTQQLLTDDDTSDNEGGLSPSFTPHNSEPVDKEKFVLLPGEKFPLDQAYYTNDGIAVRIIDQEAQDFDREEQGKKANSA